MLPFLQTHSDSQQPPPANPACCSRVLTLKQQRAKKRVTINMPRFMLTLKKCKYQFKKKNSPSYYTRSGSKNSTFPLKKTTTFMKCAISCGKTRKSETLKKNMLQQADEVEATTSKKKADYQHVPFHATVKINCKYQ